MSSFLKHLSTSDDMLAMHGIGVKKLSGNLLGLKVVDSTNNLYAIIEYNASLQLVRQSASFTSAYAPNDLVQDKYGNIYVRTGRNTINKFNSNLGLTQQRTISSGEVTKSSTSNIELQCCSETHLCFVCSDGTNNRIYVIPLDLVASPTLVLTRNQITDVRFIYPNTFIVCTMDTYDRLYTINATTFATINYTNMTTSYGSKYIYTITKNGYVLYGGASSSGCMLYCALYSDLSTQTTVLSRTATTTIRCGECDKDGNIYYIIGTGGSVYPISKYNPITKTITSVTNLGVATYDWTASLGDLVRNQRGDLFLYSDSNTAYKLQPSITGNSVLSASLSNISLMNNSSTKLIGKMTPTASFKKQ